jgi:hypothetical protein
LTSDLIYFSPTPKPLKLSRDLQTPLDTPAVIRNDLMLMERVAALLEDEMTLVTATFLATRTKTPSTKLIK